MSLALGLSLGGCWPQHTRSPADIDASEKRYAVGADYFNKGAVEPAMEELLQALQLNPANPDAHNLVGIIHLRKAEEIEELSTRNQCLRGDDLALEKQGEDAEFEKAEKEFREAVKARPDFSEAYNNLSVVAEHFNHYDEAIADGEKALSNIIYREPWAAQGNLGQAYLSKGDYVRAAAALRQALMDQPKFCVGHFRLAEVFAKQNDLEHARDELETMFADKACTSIQEAYHLAGLVALKLNDRERARAMLERCVTLAPKACLARECSLSP